MKMNYVNLFTIFFYNTYEHTNILNERTYLHVSNKLNNYKKPH